MTTPQPQPSPSAASGQRGFRFDVPAEAPPEMTALAILARSVDQLRVGLTDLAEQQETLRTRIAATRPGATGSGAIPFPGGELGGGPVTHPGLLRWVHLDRPAAGLTWVWLIEWTGWLIQRFQLYEELGSCWPRHPALVEELGALCLSWYAAYDSEAPADAPLRWLEALARARTRWRDWDDHTRCRNGRHTDRRLDLPWPADWRQHALDVAEQDIADRSPARHDAAGPDAAGSDATGRDASRSEAAPVDGGEHR